MLPVPQNEIDNTGDSSPSVCSFEDDFIQLKIDFANSLAVADKYILELNNLKREIDKYRKGMYFLRESNSKLSQEVSHLNRENINLKMILREKQPCGDSQRKKKEEEVVEKHDELKDKLEKGEQVVVKEGAVFVKQNEDPFLTKIRDRFPMFPRIESNINDLNSECEEWKAEAEKLQNNQIKSRKSIEETEEAKNHFPINVENKNAEKYAPEVKAARRKISQLLEDELHAQDSFSERCRKIKHESDEKPFHLTFKLRKETNIESSFNHHSLLDVHERAEAFIAPPILTRLFSRIA